MFSIKTLTAVLLASTAVVSAAPTATNGTKNPTKTGTHLTGVTHSVVAGLGGLRFDPDNVVAEVGDVVEWHFLPRNHSIVQSNFADPCEPLADGTGFFSGFEFFTPEGQADNVFQVVVEDKKTIWYYCAQNVGQHCKNGMVGVINQNFDNQDFSLAKHKELAALKGDAVIPPVQQGGLVIPNPNPLGGFKL
ncbi:extracellular serine-rich protein [Colletotrichum sojae]|uniref:Extracellular serine-rich protein n=1 Tax=Colletotrichum sojae TaxID=2175907 RepID=A0A8H6JRL0_9PEZI|nr:extracellular serine-rich protein [Colletotrichum sojae]